METGKIWPSRLPVEVAANALMFSRYLNLLCVGLFIDFFFLSVFVYFLNRFKET